MRDILRGIAVVLLLSTAAAAQEDTIVVTAREVARQGLEEYDAGNFEAAAKKLASAYEVVKLPTLAVAVARALAKAGQLVKASEFYLQATRLEVSGDFPAEQEQAKAEAARERSELMARIPLLVVQTEGGEPSEVSVSVDGIPVPLGLLSEGHLVDPGTRRIEGKCGTQVVTQTITLAERERRSITLSFDAKEAPPVPSPQAVSLPPVPAATAVSPAPPAPEADATAQGSPRRALGWTSLAVGGAGLLVGSVGGLSALRKKSDLDAGGCVSHHCYEDQEDDLNRYNSLRVVSTVGFVVGAVGAAVGTTLLLTAPESRPPRSGLRAWLGVDAAGVEGRF